MSDATHHPFLGSTSLPFGLCHGDLYENWVGVGEGGVSESAKQQHETHDKADKTKSLWVVNEKNFSVFFSSHFRIKFSLEIILKKE